jgi:hypothetical protein
MIGIYLHFMDELKTKNYLWVSNKNLVYTK